MPRVTVFTSVPCVAVSITEVFALTFSVVTVTVAVRAPEGIVTDKGTVAKRALDDRNVTNIGLVAADVSVTVSNG